MIIPFYFVVCRRICTRGAAFSVVQLGLSAWHISGLWAFFWVIIERMLTLPFFLFFFCIYRLVRLWGVVIRHVRGYSSVGDSL